MLSSSNVQGQGPADYILPCPVFLESMSAADTQMAMDTNVQVIFTEPLFDAANNGFLKPQMQEAVEALWADAPLKTALTQMKERFISSTQALLHGDVHTGSIMVRFARPLWHCK